MPKTANPTTPARKLKLPATPIPVALAVSPAQTRRPRAVRLSTSPPASAPLPPVADSAPVLKGRKRQDRASVAAPAISADKVTPAPAPAPANKQVEVVCLLRRPQGATIAEMMQATGWMSHSVRGLLSAVVKRKLGLYLASAIEPERGRVYRIAAPAPVPARKPASPLIVTAGARARRTRAPAIPSRAAVG